MMTPLRMVALAVAIAVASFGARAQSSSSPNMPGSPMGQMRAMPMHHPMGDMMAHSQQGAVSNESGQAAFGTIQEIVAKLQADPQTDWSKVDVDALRQHLIDMDEVTMRAVAQKEPIENGLRIRVTGNDRTLAAIQRM